MPLLSEDDPNLAAEDYNSSLLIYGEPKTSKSRWFFESGATYHNVIYIDCDNCAAHRKLVPQEHRGRFAYIPAYRKPMQTLALLSQLCIGPHRAVWNEETQSMAPAGTMGDPETPVVTIDIGATDNSTILVVDGWSSLCQAVYEFHGTDIATSKQGDALYSMDADRSDYKSMYAQLQGMLNRFKAFGCLFATITWEEEHIEYDPRSIGAGKKASDAIITRVVKQPVSIAHKHGRIFAGYFGQVLRFRTGPMGPQIVSKTSADTMAGGSLLAPAEHNYGGFPFSKYATESGQQPAEIQPIADVIRYTTLGEARAKPKSPAGAKTVLRPVS